MAAKIQYVGIFLTDEAKKQLLEAIPPMHAKVFADHVTLAFKPDEKTLKDFELFIGKPAHLLVEGYALDEKADCVRVVKDLLPLCSNEYAHITISCSDGTSPVYSNELLSKYTPESGTSILVSPNGHVIAKAFRMFTVEGVFDTFPRSLKAP